MLQSLKQPPRWLINASRRPQSALARLRYQLQGWATPAMPAPHERVLNSLSEEDDEFRHLSFTFAIIALAARVACADGPLSRDKYIAFRESFPLRGDICGKIRNLFTLACANDTPLEHYVHQIKYMYPGKSELFISMVERLFHIAVADGTLGRKAEFILADIAHALGISAASFADIRERYAMPVHAHQVLGVSPGIKSSALKKRYHELMRRYHPDRYGAEELSDEIRILLRAKTSEINAAYKILAKRAA